MKELTGKLVLVTGGTSGIGLGLAQACAEAGARLAITGTQQDKLARTLSTLLEAGANVAGYLFDVSDHEAWEPMVSRIEAENGPIDMLVLNAGINCGRGPLESFSVEDWRRVMAVNLDGLFYGLKTCVPRLKLRPQAHVLITASIGTLVRRPFAMPYDVSKAGAISIAEILRQELSATSVGVSLFNPGGVRSEIDLTSTRQLPQSQNDRFAYMKDMTKTMPMADPTEVGRYVIKAVQAGQFDIFSHPQFAAPILSRHEEMAEALRSSAGVTSAE